VNLSAVADTPDQYGVAGHPIAHSWSPFIHGMFAKATAQNLVYRLFDIAPNSFRREALRLFAAGLRGMNVTLPHKQAAAELVNELTPRAERAQAVNTIAFFEDTSLLGDNTDGLGLTADLERNLAVSLTGKRVLILGAGGAVRGVLGPLLERDLGEVLIANRTPERAHKLAAEFADLGQITGCGFADIHGPPYDLIINATSAGRPRQRRDDLLRHGLRPRPHPLHPVGQISARRPHHQRLGHAGRTSRRIIPPLARRPPQHCAGSASPRSTRLNADAPPKVTPR
jgi:shikimate dehydrogenase